VSETDRGGSMNTWAKEKIAKYFKLQNMNFLTQAEGVANNNNGETFQWYIAKVRPFDGINLKMASFNGTNPICPYMFCICQ
jgi:hypothetical protein